MVAWSEGSLPCKGIAGRPASSTARSGAAFIEALVRDLCTRARLFHTGDAADPAAILEMLVENATEALGASPPGLATAARQIEQLSMREAVIADARLHPWEWLCTPARYRNVDALDHGDGLRLPGPAGEAWGLAGVAIEDELSDEVLEGLIQIHPNSSQFIPVHPNSS